METKKILEEIIDILKTMKYHRNHDDIILYCDLDYKMICYSVENMLLFEQKRITFPTLGGDNRKVSFKRDLAKFKLINDDESLKFKKLIIESKSDIELAEILQELKEHHAKEHVL